MSQRRICEPLNVAESSQRYESRRSDEALRERLVEAAREKPRWGYRGLQVKLEEKGMHVNHKRVYRVYREAGLLIRRRKRKRLVRAGFERPTVTGANQEWVLDFCTSGGSLRGNSKNGEKKSCVQQIWVSYEPMRGERGRSVQHPLLITEPHFQRSQDGNSGEKKDYPNTQGKPGQQHFWKNRKRKDYDYNEQPICKHEPTIYGCHFDACKRQSSRPHSRIVAQRS